MNHIDLFSGIGGFALAAKWTFEDKYTPLAHSEIESFPCKVYHKHFPSSLCLGDITKIDWSAYEGRCDLLTGGFPCQPHSVAGKRKASEDTRDLWGECIRALCGIRSQYALFENVPGLLTSERGRFFNRVLSDLAAAGYDAEWQTISACAVGAPHTRERVWIVAYDSKSRLQKKTFKHEKNGRIYSAWSSANISRDLPVKWENFSPNNRDIRNGHGVRNWMDRISSLGNAIVPQVAQILMQRIKFQMENSP